MVSIKRVKGKLIKFLLKDTKGTFILCGKCNSPFIKFSKVATLFESKKKIVIYEVKCLECESIATVRESWDTIK